MNAIALFLLGMTMSQSELPRTRAELTAFEETTRYEEVIGFIDALQRLSPLVHVESFGRTREGRSMPLMVIADPPLATPRDVAGSGKPVVFVMANIHGGEVEGKEAILALVRRLLLEDLGSLLEDIVLLVAPIYNADGNDRIALDNRGNQNGPIGGVGTRQNAMGLDLNRDYMKMDSPEAEALVGLFNRWDPHVIVDLHTTNGSRHGYHLTYSPPLNPNAAPGLIDYERNTMLPALTQAVLDNHGVRTYYYGNFATLPGGEGRPDEGNRVWQTFDHRPRFGNNYGGLRNRISILSEAYAYLDFRGRVEATSAFVEEILKYSADNGGEIMALVQSLDEAAIRRGMAGAEASESGVRFDFEKNGEDVEILIGEVGVMRNPRNGEDMTSMVVDRFAPERMDEYGTFQVDATAALPRAYVFRPESRLETVLEKLLAHGIVVEEAAEEFTASVDAFEIGTIDRSQREFEGHREVSLAGRFESREVTFPARSIIVRTAQPLSALAAYLLEPESDDGMVNWNFLDEVLAEGEIYPIFKAHGELRVGTRILRR